MSSTGTLTAAVATEASTRATEDGKLQAQYVLKVGTTRGDGKQYVAGIGLASTTSGTIGQSEILFQADRFVFANPTDLDGPLVPMMTIGTVNGVPNQVIIRTALIGDATIGSAMVGQLTAANLTVGAISSTINGGAGSGTGRIVITSNRIDVIDAGDVVRVRLGAL